MLHEGLIIFMMVGNRDPASGVFKISRISERMKQNHCELLFVQHGGILICKMSW